MSNSRATFAIATDAITDLYAEGEPDYEWIWETVTGIVKTRQVAYKGSKGDTLMGKPYNEAKKRVRKWVPADLDREADRTRIFNSLQK